MPDAETYAFYKSRGICVRCMQADAYGGKTLCLTCQGKSLEESVRYCQTMTPEKRAAKNRRQADYSKRLRLERKALGICTACGKHPAKPQRTLCPICADKQNRRQEERRMRSAEQQGKDPTPRFKRTALGKCYICGEPVSPENKNVCPLHLEAQRKKAAHMRSRIDYQNHPFRQWAAAFYAERRWIRGRRTT